MFFKNASYSLGLQSVVSNVVCNKEVFVSFFSNLFNLFVAQRPSSTRLSKIEGLIPIYHRVSRLSWPTYISPLTISSRYDYINHRNYSSFLSLSAKHNYSMLHSAVLKFRLKWQLWIGKEKWEACLILHIKQVELKFYYDLNIKL